MPRDIAPIKALTSLTISDSTMLRPYSTRCFVRSKSGTSAAWLKPKVARAALCTLPPQVTS